MLRKVMDINYDKVAILRSRPNRFLGIVDLVSPGKEKGKNVKVHIQDPGRLKELLYPDNKILIKRMYGEKRKTSWDVIAANFKGEWVLINSGFHRAISEWVINSDKVNPFGKIKEVFPEKKFGNSRFDFLLIKPGKKKMWVEVKGCTLAESGVAKFPDAPTTRGRKHLDELRVAKKKGDSAGVLILVFRKDAKCFTPHEKTDPEFAQAFRDAIDAGVKAHILKFKLKDSSLYFLNEIPVCSDRY
jgi:sugar fermentation stimulation protein A